MRSNVGSSSAGLVNDGLNRILVHGLFRARLDLLFQKRDVKRLSSFSPILFSWHLLHEPCNLRNYDFDQLYSQRLARLGPYADMLCLISWQSVLFDYLMCNWMTNCNWQSDFQEAPGSVHYVVHLFGQCHSLPNKSALFFKHTTWSWWSSLHHHSVKCKVGKEEKKKITP